MPILPQPTTEREALTGRGDFSLSRRLYAARGQVAKLNRFLSTRRRLQQSHHGQHPPGPTFLRAIRIVVLQVTSSADLVIVNLFDPALATLSHNLRREIDFVMRRTDAGTQLNDEIGRLDPEFLPHQVDCTTHNPEHGPFFSGMNQSNCPGISVHQVNRAAISHVNSKANTALIGNQPIAIFETVISDRDRIKTCDVVSMNLAHGDKFAIAQPNSVSCQPMNLVEVFQDNRFVMRQLDSRNTSHESVMTNDTLQRGKRFDRQNATLQASSSSSWCVWWKWSVRNRR